MKKWLYHPLLHFLLLGTGLFGFYYWLNPKADSVDEIVLDDEIVNRSIAIFQKEWGRLPGLNELAGLIETEIRQEVYYRQALKMKLDHNDELVKRRMQQKLSFITHDLISHELPSEDSLQSFYKRNFLKYQLQPTVSFSQAYFNPDNRGDPLKDAKKMLEVVASEKTTVESVENYGDAFSLLNGRNTFSKEELVKLMGTDFANSLFSLSPEKWHGPVLSGYGVHLVYVHALKEAQAPKWADVRENVLRDYQYEASQQFNEKVYQGFRKQYRIRLNLRDSVTSKYELGKKLQVDEVY